MAMDIGGERSEIWTTAYLETGRYFTAHYFKYLKENSEKYDSLVGELENLIVTHNKMAKREDHEARKMLINYTRLAAPFLKERSFHSVLLNFCESTINASESLDINAGWVHILQFEAHYALGAWDAALTDIQSAIRQSYGDETDIYARAVLSLGRLQLNQGYYREALDTLQRAESLLQAQNDDEGLAAAKAEVAAYYLNRDELDTALALYLEADQIYRQSGIRSSSDHTLLMLGVVYRRAGDYAKSTNYLKELLSHGQYHKNNSAIATASHHLAWTYLNRGHLRQAKIVGEEARRLYQEIRDPRGESDADEQLGLIVLAEGDKQGALNYLKRSLYMRKKLGNQHRIASCQRRLALVHIQNGDLLKGVAYLIYGLFAYWRLGMLSQQRLRGIWNEFKQRGSF